MLKATMFFFLGFVVALLVVPSHHTLSAQVNTLVPSPVSEPVVPPMSRHMHGFNWSGGIQQLDGIDCSDCQITDAIVTYAGGQFKCIHCKVAVKGFVFKGAALNTVNLLVAMDALKPAANIDNNPNTPNMRSAKLETSSTLDLVSWVR
jgi:hypothetical protein